MVLFGGDSSNLAIVEEFGSGRCDQDLSYFYRSKVILLYCYFL
jgi:hypothetical protein